MQSRIAGVVLLLLSSFAASGQCFASEAMSAQCPVYRVALREAKTALERGDRKHAITALQEAKAALRACQREEARGTSLLATAKIASQLTL